MTTIQKWYTLLIFNIISVVYSLTLFDLSINHGAYPVIHCFFFILVACTIVFSILMACDIKEIRKHITWLYKEFIKVIKFYLNI